MILGQFKVLKFSKFKQPSLLSIACKTILRMNFSLKNNSEFRFQEKKRKSYRKPSNSASLPSIVITRDRR